MDKKSRMRLIRWAFLPLVMYTLADMVVPPPPDPINNYSMEYTIDGATYRIAGDTKFLMMDGTPIPVSINGTPVETLQP